MAQPHTFNNPARISRPAPFLEWQHSLPSRVAEIAPWIDTVMRFIKLLADKFCRAEESEFAIETALREALANSMIHGNRQEAHKRVHITCRCSMDGEITITLQDEGKASTAVRCRTRQMQRTGCSATGAEFILCGR